MALRTPLVITAPTVEPVTVAQFKAWSNIEHAEDDTKIADMLVAARRLFENHTGRTLHETVLECYPPCFPYYNEPITLPRAAPLISVSAIAYKDSTGAETVWSTSEWVSSTRTLPGRVAPAYGYCYPTFTPYPLDPIRIRYTAGIANASPQTYPDEWMQSAILSIAASLYEMPEAELLTDMSAVKPEMLSFGAHAAIIAAKVEW